MCRIGHKFELCHPHAQRGCFIHMFNMCKLVGSKGLTFGAGRTSCGVWHSFFGWHHAALSIAGQGHTAVTVWKGKGDRSCVHSKGAVVELLPWSRRRQVPVDVGIFPSSDIQGRNRAALQAALTLSVLPFTLYQLTDTVKANLWKNILYPIYCFISSFYYVLDILFFSFSFRSSNYMVPLRIVLI